MPACHSLVTYKLLSRNDSLVLQIIWNKVADIIIFQVIAYPIDGALELVRRLRDAYW